MAASCRFTSGETPFALIAPAAGLLAYLYRWASRQDAGFAPMSKKAILYVRVSQCERL